MPPGYGAPAPVAAPADPYASLRPAPGHFNMAAQDDGVPVASINKKGGSAGLVVTIAIGLVGLVGGYWFGGAVGARYAFNNANQAAKIVKSELDVVSKNVSSIRDAVALSQQRTKGDNLGFDPQLIDQLAKLDLKNKPSTLRIFKVDYYRLPDLVVDNLMSYYYDSIALYGEVDEHVRRTQADKASLEEFQKKLVDKAQAGGQANYGVVFDRQGALTIANLVEVGSPVCKGGGADCQAKDIEAFQIRAANGAPWGPRKMSAALDGASVVPIKPTPLFDAVMTGSPEQVRMEAYKLRYLTIQRTIKRLEQVQKELVEAVDKAAVRENLFAP
jgi:hypothetical protein